MFGLGVQEIMLILLIAVFFFGGEKIPDIAKGLGKGCVNSNAPWISLTRKSRSQPGR